MKLSKFAKALLVVLGFITFNILTDIFLFGQKMAPKHFGTAILGGIGGGLACYLLFNKKKNAAGKFSSDLKPNS